MQVITHLVAKGREIKKEQLSELVEPPEGTGENETMIPVDMLGFGDHHFEDVDHAVEKLGVKATAEAFLKSRECFDKFKAGVPERGLVGLGPPARAADRRRVEGGAGGRRGDRLRDAGLWEVALSHFDVAATRSRLSWRPVRHASCHAAQTRPRGTRPPPRSRPPRRRRRSDPPPLWAQRATVLRDVSSCVRVRPRAPSDQPQEEEDES
ncbi:unnamed protein product, partial [Prorocentrum cordatum]